MRTNRIMAVMFLVFTLAFTPHVNAKEKKADLMQILAGLTTIRWGPCHGEDGIEYSCVECTKKGEAGVFLVVLSSDEEELVITHVVGETHTVIWQKEETNTDFE